MKIFTKLLFYIAIFLCVIVSSCKEDKQLKLRQFVLNTHFNIDFENKSSVSESEFYMGVYIANMDSVMISNVKFESKDREYVLSDSLEIVNHSFIDKRIQFFAYMPYVDVEEPDVEKHKVSVFENQQSLENYQASNFKCAGVQYNVSNSKVNIRLEEKFSKIIVNVNKRGLENVHDNVEVEVVDVSTSATINLKTGIFSFFGTIDDVKPLQKDVSNLGFDVTYQAIIIPQEKKADKTILRIKVNDQVYSYRAKYDTTFEPSMHYVYNIAFEGGLSVGCEELSRVDSASPKVFRRIYKIGDYYPIADDPVSAIGVVFSTIDNGMHGKIISLDESLELTLGPLLETGAKSKRSGANNKKIIFGEGHNLFEYEALNWCTEKGEGWYLPAIEELAEMYKQKIKINRSISPLLRGNSLSRGVYISSTEYDKSEVLVFHFGNGQRFHQNKSSKSKVRAVREF